MSLRVLIVPDKFKGTLTAHQAAEWMARGWRAQRPHDVIELLPMSDGGDGFGEVLSSALGLSEQNCPTQDAARQSIQATWWWDEKTGTAIIESAKVIGLALLPSGKFHPFELDTFGLGAVIDAAEQKGAQRLLMGIGGSATNDGGFGVARARGWKFFTEAGEPILKWNQLDRLARIEPPTERRSWSELTVAVDVQNPLLGPRGASRIYGPQKGLRPEDMRDAERHLERLAQVVQQQLGISAADEPGAGAAGGLGFGLRAFLGARLESGFEIFARCSKLEVRIAAADVVITGEGAIDSSTLMGKGVGEVAALAQKHFKPCLGLAGTLLIESARPETREKFQLLMGMAPHLTDSEQARRSPEHWLPQLAMRAAGEWTKRHATSST
jgi:glycerate 2-kinase